jgi:DNA-binding NarL/FixJ family response regulator
MEKLRIFLADDHPVLLRGLKSLLATQPDMEVVGEASDGHSAWQQARELQPQVVIMDLSMPGLNGARATEQLKQACPNVQVLVLTVHEEPSYLRRLFQAGASGYLLKRTAAECLIHAIRTVATGGVYLDPALAGDLVSRVTGKQPLRGFTAGEELSEREQEVLRLIAEGFSNKEIAARLDLSVKTVETYKARAMEKLGLSGRVEIVQYALQQGWLHES